MRARRLEDFATGLKVLAGANGVGGLTVTFEIGLNVNRQHDGLTDLVILVGIPAQHDDGNPVFEANRVYNIRVSAMAYGRSTNDTEIRALALVEPNTNTTMTVEGETEAVSVDAHTRYRVRIECEGADTFEFFNGEEWEEVHHGDDMNDEEREQIGDGDGACEFYAWTGDSGTYALLPDETYTVNVSNGKPCWDGNSTTLTFNVVAPEDDGLRLIVPNADDVWVNDPVQASLYAPGASRCWIEGDGIFDSKGEFTSGTDYAIIDIDSGCSAWQPGIAKLTGYAEYTDGEGNVTETKQTDTVEIEVKSLGRVGLPVINAPEALKPDDEALTFSIGYSDLPEIPEDWEDFDFQNGYSWHVSMLDGDGDFHGDWETIVDWTDMQRGEGDTSEEITIGADQGFEWREGAIYRIGVNTWANRCEGNGTELSLICVSAYDENVTLEVVPDSGRDLDQLLHNESLKLVINAPRDSDRFELFTGYQWEDYYPNYDENAEAFICDRNFGEGIYNLAVRARYADEEGGEMVMHAPSRPVQITVNCLGKLDAPEVTVVESEITRGEFLKVNLSEVTADGDPVDSYSVEIWRYMEEYDETDLMEEYEAVAGENRIPTTDLWEGDYYFVKATAHKEGWDSRTSEQTDATRFYLAEPTEEGLVLNVSTEEASTGEQWWISSVYTGDPDAGYLVVSVLDENGDYYDCVPRSGIYSDNANGRSVRQAYMMKHAGTYTVKVWLEDEDGETRIYEETATVVVTAPNGDLEIGFGELPTEFDGLQVLEVPVTVNNGVERFDLKMTKLHQGEILTVFEQTDIPTTNKVDGTVVTVEVPLQGIDLVNDRYTLEVNTWQAGWNEASDSVVIGGGDSEALDAPEIADIMPSVIKGHNINIEMNDVDERATRTYATIVAEDVTYPQYELEADGRITIPTNDLQPGIYQINICSEAEDYISSATTVSVRVLDVDAWLTLPLGMKTIGEEAFAGTGAEIIEIPEDATSIGSKAFANSKAGYVYIPDSVTEIADDAFEGCEDLVIECLYGSCAETYCEENDIYCNGYGE